MTHWIKQAQFYHIYPLGFCGAPQYASEEKETAHRIKKIITWIEHLKAMHINALYLGPIFSSFEHGYDTSDYRLLDHRLGTNEDMMEVANALHENGIRLVLDGVFNHVGREFWAFQDLLEKGEASSYKDWFHHVNFHGSSPYGDPFSYDSWEGHYNLVKLNLKNEEVVQYLLDSVGYWIDAFDIDGLRLDAADCIDHDFFRRLKAYTKARKDDFWLMGEIIHGNYAVWANPDMLDSVTNYECYKGLYSSHNTKNYFEIAYSLNRQFGNGGIYQNLDLYNFVDNHDVNRLSSTLNNTSDLENVYTMLYAMPGIPSIYYGSEFSCEGVKQRGSDANLRPCLELTPNNRTHPLVKHIKKLGEIRANHPALCFGNYEQVMLKNEQYIFVRKYEKESVYAAFNCADSEQSLTIQTTQSLKNAFTNEVYVSKNNQVQFSLGSHESAILLETSMKPSVKKTKPVFKKAMKETKETITQPLSIQIGHYRHFKGNDYAVLYIAKHSETQEPYVVYRALYGECNVWIRPLSMFVENVEVDGQKVPRFTYIGK